MYILYRVEYPGATFPPAHVQNAWTAAGLPQPVPTFEGETVGPTDVADLLNRTLLAVGAMVSRTDGAMEVPRSSAETLRRLEDLYQRLYPETKNSRHRGHFQYEEVEWLGEF
jgi:hypothetical protein